MAYADYAHYTVGYLLGRDPILSEQLFPYWEKQARAEIDKHTFDRVKDNPWLLCDQVKDCTCELAEFLYQADGMSQQSMQQGAFGPLVSYSNDGESASFDLSRSDWTAEGRARRIREIIFRYLGNTGLLYAGV